MKKQDAKKGFDVSKFEKLETHGNTLKGVFSTVFVGAGKGRGLEVNANKCGQTNNCQGENCVAGCGSSGGNGNGGGKELQM